jgi:hypothetical protein
MSDPGKTPARRLILLCIPFIVSGVYMWFRRVDAMKSGELVDGLSPPNA